MSGFRPWPQNMPVKSSKAKSIPQLHQNRSASTTQSAKQKINQVFNQLKKLKLNNVNKFLKKITSHLCLEALNIVISNPDSLVIGIGHVLGVVPSLCGSFLQEGADLAGRKDLN